MSRMIFPLSRRVSYRMFERWSITGHGVVLRGGHWCFFVFSPG